MYITVELKAFQNSIANAVLFTATKPTNNLLIMAELSNTATALTIRTTDLDNYYSTSLDVSSSCGDNSTVLVEAKTLLALLKTIKTKQSLINVYDEIVDSEKLLVITTAEGITIRTRISDLEMIDFPVIVEAELLTVNSTEFSSVVEKSLLSVSTDETKQVLTGIYCQYQNDTLKLAACDGHRLSVTEIESESINDTEFSFNLSGATATRLLKILKNAGKDITITIGTIFNKELHDSGSNYKGRPIISIISGKTEIKTLLLEGQYPNFQQLIPALGNLATDFPREKTIEALERLSVGIKKNKDCCIAFTIDHEAQIAKMEKTIDSLGYESIRIESHLGDDQECYHIAFNVKYLIDGLKSFDSSIVRFNFGASNTNPVVLSTTQSNQIYLVMPIHMRDEKPVYKKEEKKPYTSNPVKDWSPTDISEEQLKATAEKAEAIRTEAEAEKERIAQSVRDSEEEAEQVRINAALRIQADLEAQKLKEAEAEASMSTETVETIDTNAVYYLDQAEKDRIHNVIKVKAEERRAERIAAIVESTEIANTSYVVIEHNPITKKDPEIVLTQLEKAIHAIWDLGLDSEKSNAIISVIKAMYW